MYVDIHITKHVCRGQRILAKILISPSIMWTPVIKFMS